MKTNCRSVVRVMMAAVLTVALVGCSQEGKIAKHLEKGNELYEAGEYEAATLEYLNVLRADQSNQVAITRSALAHFEMGNGLQAITFLREAVKLEPDNLEYRQKLGTLFRLARLIPEAREQALAILERDPDNFDGLLLLVDTAFPEEDVLDAEARLVDREAMFGEDYKYHLARAQLAIRKRDKALAESSLNRALELKPDDVLVLSALADFHDSLGNAEDAKGYLQQAAEASDSVSEARVKWAGLRYNQGAKEEAVETLRAMVEEDARFLPAWTRLGNYALVEGRLDEAQEAVDAMYDVNPELFDARLLQARLWLVKGETDQAVDAFERLLEQNDKSVLLHHQLAMAYLRAGKVDPAKERLRSAIELNPQLTEAILQLANLNLRTGEAPTAVRDLEALIGERGGFPKAMILLAQGYLAVNEPDRALSTFRGLEDMQPDSHVGPYLSGQVLLQQNKNAEARKAFETALERSPDSVPIITRLAILDLRDEQPDAAIARLESAIAKTPDAAGLNQRLGVVYAQTGKPDLAEQAFRREMEIAPDDMTPYMSLTRLLVQLGRADEALTEMEQALVAKPDDARALMLSAMLLEQTGETDQALERYDRLIELAPQFAQAKNNAAYLYATRKQDLDKAFELARSARELLPEDAAIADTLGWIVYNRGDHAYAATLIREAAAKFADHPEVQVHLGTVELALGRETEAREALTKALEKGGEGLENREAVQALVDLLVVPADQVSEEQQPLIETVLVADADSAAARTRQALLALRTGDEAALDEAKEAFEGVLESYPRYLPATLGLIDLLAGPLDDPAEALKLAIAARVDLAGNADINRRAGWLGVRQGEFYWAMGILQEAAQALPDDPEIQKHLALALYLNGKQADALGKLDTLLESLPEDAAIRPESERLVTLIRASGGQDPDPAVVEVAKLVPEDHPDRIPADLVTALSLASAGDAAGAAAQLEALSERAPAFGLAIRETARLYATDLNDIEKAYDLASDAREALPEDPSTALILGRLAYAQEDYPYALRLLEEGLRAIPDDVDSLYLLGLSRHQDGDPDGAKEALEKALELAPDSEFAEDAKAALAPPPEPVAEE